MSTQYEIPTTGSASAPTLYLAWLHEQIGKRTPMPADPDAPFLSVLMRTQGKRDEALKEALLSLQAQSDRDFEVLLVLHKTAKEDRERTLQLVSSLVPELRERIHCHTLDTGTRSSPLNLALSLARGRYIAMLDDDDVVLEDWVENFHKGADEHDGMTIRCYGMTQFWTVDQMADGSTRLCSVTAPQPTYCEPFDMQAHLRDNHTPISCLAIPRTCHSLFGICFDEVLTTAEDWDFLMHCAMLCGVFDTGRITFLYRLWQNVESSRTLHREEEWLKNRSYILEKLAKIPYVTAPCGAWPITRTGEEPAVLRLSLWDKLKKLYHTHGPLRFPFVLIRKVLHRLFG